MNLLVEDVHDPLFEVFPLNPPYRTVVFNPQQHHAASEISHGHNLHGKLLGSDIVALEPDAGTLAVSDNFEQLGL